MWQVGDGRSVRFWLDKWVPNEPPLALKISNPNLVINATLSVREVIDISGTWKSSFLKDHVPTEIYEKIMALPSPLDEDGDDLVVWVGTNHNRFSIRGLWLMAEFLPMKEGINGMYPSHQLVLAVMMVMNPLFTFSVIADMLPGSG